MIEDGQYKKNDFVNNIMYNLIELYFRESNSSFSKLVYEKYSYFLKRVSDTKNYNLDKEILFMEFEDKILNG